MAPTGSLKIVLIAWLVICVGTLVWRGQGPVEGMGFQQGMTRAGVFFLGQAVAVGLAIHARALARLQPRGSGLRILGQVPIFTMLLLVVVALFAVFRAIGAQG